MAKLRFDLAAEAITTLQRYMDTCADDRNTLVLLNSIKGAVDRLLAMEQGVRQSHVPGQTYGSNSMSAMAEIDCKMDAMRRRVRPLQQFMAEYRDEILSLKESFTKLQDMAAVVNGITKLEKQLQGVRRKVTLI